MGFEFISLNDVDEPFLSDYRNLKKQNPTRHSENFIVEGRWLVERLLTSRYTVASLLIESSQRDAIERWATQHELPSHNESVAVYVVPRAAMEQLVGFTFHRGLMGCGVRQSIPTLNQAIENVLEVKTTGQRWLAVYLIGIQDPENMGLCLRTAVGLGIPNILLGPGSCDPYARRVLRVSMGVALKANFYEANDVGATLARLHAEDVVSFATSLQQPNTPLTKIVFPPHALVLLGNEAHGLPDECQQLAKQRLYIPMAEGVDSLNVSVAGGIVLYNLLHRTTHPQG